MRTTKQMSITVPNEMADIIANKVKAGEYASESEVLRDGLRALIARDKAVDSWLMQQVAPTYDRMKADPTRGLTIEQVREQIAKNAGK